MIEFLKTVLKNVNFNSKNKQLNTFNKIIYSIIILCALYFIGSLIFLIIKNFPKIIDSIIYNWNNAKSIFIRFN
jgi:hypothetical protein